MVRPKFILLKHIQNSSQRKIQKQFLLWLKKIQPKKEKKKKYIYIYIYKDVYICIYIYIYREREREGNCLKVWLPLQT